jgi:hypothetical protein
MQWF